MSSSEKGGKIDFDDDVKLLTKKIKEAYSLDGEVKGNGLLAMLKYVLFRWLDSKGRILEVPRAEKYGGPQKFSTYEEAELAFEKKELMSGDLKLAVTNILVELLAPLREFCSQNKDLLARAYPSEVIEVKIETKPQQKTENKPQQKGGKNQPKQLSPYEIDLRVGQIIEIEKHPKSDRLYVEKIDVGEDKPRTIISGLAEHYTLDELKGRKLLVMCNLKSTDIGKLGIISEGMVVASNLEEGGKTVVKLVDVPENAKVGERVTWSGLDKQDPELTLKPDRLKKILKLMTANSEGKALFDSKNVCTTTGGECTTPLKNSVLG